VKKHVRRTKEGEGGIVTIEAPLHVSNVSLIDPVTGCAVEQPLLLQLR
jgi:large subunit ribosomal protein L24